MLLARRSSHLNHASLSRDSLNNYYKNSNVLITGGTGFLGKVIIEKLLRSFPELKSIYVLARPTKGNNINKRIEDISDNALFKQLSYKNPYLLKKVKIIEGDIVNNNIITHKNQEEEVINNTNIVIHSAATTSFNGPLKYSMQHNAFGTQKMLDLATKMKHLKKFVHVSSTYSNCPQINVKECFYKPKHDAQDIMKFIKEFSEMPNNTFTKHLIESHPNTYTYAKAQAEWIVNSYADKLPLTVVRPSIIVSSWKDPFPGWVDNFNAINYVCYGLMTGLLRSLLVKKNIYFDLIPVDVVSNAVIASPWHSTYYMNDMKIPIYNCASSTVNPIKIADFTENVIESAKKYPTSKLSGYPWHPYINTGLKRSFFMYLEKSISHLNDIILQLQQQKPRNVQLHKLIMLLVNETKILFEKPLLFQSDNFQKMINDVKNCKEAKEFDIDIRKTNNFDWKTFFDNHVLGIRSHVLKEDVWNNKNVTTLDTVFWKDMGKIIAAMTPILYTLIFV